MKLDPKTYLTDAEIEKVEAFCGDATMREAVRKVLLTGLYVNGTVRQGYKPSPLQNFALALAFDPRVSNEELGADLRASAAGINLLENAFKQIDEIAGASAALKSPVQPNKKRTSQ